MGPVCAKTDITLLWSLGESVGTRATGDTACQGMGATASDCASARGAACRGHDVTMQRLTGRGGAGDAATGHREERHKAGYRKKEPVGKR